MDEDYVLKVLDELSFDSKTRKARSPGRLATLKVLVELGEGWHTDSEVYKTIKKYLKTQLYTFELSARFPRIVQKKAPNLVRISPEAFPYVEEYVSARLDKLLS